MKASATLLLLAVECCLAAVTSHPPSGVKNATRVEVQQQRDYYSYEYSDDPLENNRSNKPREAVSWLVPDPDQLAAQDPEDQEDEIPESNLSDGDLHDHDVMDSVMYIYFGPSPRAEGGTSAQVVLAGAAVALFAQALTSLAAIRRAIRARYRRATAPASSAGTLQAALALLHTELALAATSLVFIFTVHGTGEPARCQAAALLLHYLHLSAACWLVANCVRIFLWLAHESRGCSLQALAATAWALPLLLVLVSYVIHPEGYEFHHYCWLSVHKGMLVSFLLPLAALISGTTALAVLGVRRHKIHTGAPEDSARLGLRLGAALLPLFAVSWFLGVLALEQPQSLAAALLFAATTSLFNWLLFACASSLFPNCPLTTLRSPALTPAPLLATSPTLQHDAQPLLPAAASSEPARAWAHGWTPSSHPERLSSPAPRRAAATWCASEVPNVVEGGNAEDEAEETSGLLELRLDNISTIST